jgi:hypothetical protein
MKRKMINGEPIGPQTSRRFAIKRGWSEGAWGALDDTGK